MKIPKLIPALKMSPITLQELNKKEVINAVVMTVRFFIIVDITLYIILIIV